MTDALEARTRLSARQASDEPPLFVRTYAFDFYDGPETGIAVTPDGSTYRFEAIGEARYRTYRAYLLAYLTGQPPVWAGEDGFFIDASQWEVVARIPSAERYVAISDPWLKCFVVERLPDNVRPPADFDEAHRLLRSKFAVSNLSA